MSAGCDATPRFQRGAASVVVNHGRGHSNRSTYFRCQTPSSITMIKKGTTNVMTTKTHIVMGPIVGFTCVPL